PPAQLVSLLDDVFRRFDALAADLRLEKIKTIGDAYMVAAGAPEPRADHAEAAAEMALGILEVMRESTWPTGDPLQVRVGIASGPVVAGVIGRQKFAYDLWGDTVNLASRLESNGEPGRILVSETTQQLLEGRFRFDAPCTVDLKGRGPTRAYFLLGRA
ncbi:MAG: adenylate/guanylate cyclase domain-containing protein, partial [Actinomycetota bacterium]